MSQTAPVCVACVACVVAGQPRQPDPFPRSTSVCSWQYSTGCRRGSLVSQVECIKGVAHLGLGCRLFFKHVALPPQLVHHTLVLSLQHQRSQPQGGEGRGGECERQQSASSKRRHSGVAAGHKLSVLAAGIAASHGHGSLTNMKPPIIAHAVLGPESCCQQLAEDTHTTHSDT